MANPPKATKKARRNRPQITMLKFVGKPDLELAAKRFAPFILDRITREREKVINKKPDTKN